MAGKPGLRKPLRPQVSSEFTLTMPILERLSATTVSFLGQPMVVKTGLRRQADQPINFEQFGLQTLTQARLSVIWAPFCERQTEVKPGLARLVACLRSF